MKIQRAKSGFTLIELLVVISIIALLLSIVMPSLAKVKDSARRVICQSNLRQQNIGVSMYVEDNDSVFPSVYVPNADNPNPNTSASASYFCYGGRQSETAMLSLAGQTVNGRRLINPYLGAPEEVGFDPDKYEKVMELFRCPADKGSLDGAWPGRQPTEYETSGRSYRFNTDAINNDGTRGLWNKRKIRAKNPQELIMLGDMSLNTYFANLSFGYPVFRKYFWHDKKELGWANISFADLHIEYLQLTSGRDSDTGLVVGRSDFQHGPNWRFVWDD